MIVCTCDICGQVVSEWSVLNINLKNNMWKREVCNNCYKSTVGKLRLRSPGSWQGCTPGTDRRYSRCPDYRCV